MFLTINLKTKLLSLATTHKNFFRNTSKAVSDGAISFHLDHRDHSRFSISHTTQVTQTINTGLRLGPGGSVVFQYYPTQTELFISFLQKIQYIIYNEKFLFVEYAQVSETKKFRRSYHWAIDSAARFRVI